MWRRSVARRRSSSHAGGLCPTSSASLSTGSSLWTTTTAGGHAAGPCMCSSPCGCSSRSARTFVAAGRVVLHSIAVDHPFGAARAAGVLNLDAAVLLHSISSSSSSTVLRWKRCPRPTATGPRPTGQPAVCWPLRTLPPPARRVPRPPRSRGRGRTAAVWQS